MRRTSCPECGEPADEDTEFCLRCGGFLDWSDLAADEPARPHGPPAREVPAGPVAPPPAPADEEAPTARLGSAGSGAATGEPAASAAGRSATAVAPAVTAPAAEPACSRCGSVRQPGRRFCVRCALEFEPPAAGAAWAARSRPRTTWWQRLLGRTGGSSDRAARRAYRRNLPLRYRLFRALGGVLVVVLLVGAVAAVRGDPLGWARARWYDLNGTVVPLAGVPAADPAEPVVPEFPAGGAVDGDETTAWATTWAGDGSAAPTCGARQTTGGLLLTFDQVADVRQVVVFPGLPDGDPLRLQQHRPRVVEVRSAEGHCGEYELDDVAAPQTIVLDPPLKSTSLRVDVVAVHPGDGSSPLVAISEIDLRQRPPG
jgi:hypothetical protein